MVNQAAAAIAGLDMAAQRWRPAGHDLGHDPGLLGADPMAPAIALAVTPKDLRQLQAPRPLGRDAQGSAAGRGAVWAAVQL